MIEVLNAETGELEMVPARIVTCQDEDCENYNFDILVPDIPDSPVMCGVCRGWIIPPVEIED